MNGFIFLILLIPAVLAVCVLCFLLTIALITVCHDEADSNEKEDEEEPQTMSSTTGLETKGISINNQYGNESYPNFKSVTYESDKELLDRMDITDSDDPTLPSTVCDFECLNELAGVGNVIRNLERIDNDASSLSDYSNLEIFASIQMDRNEEEISNLYTLNMEAFNTDEKDLLKSVKSFEKKMDKELKILEEDYSLYSTDLQTATEFEVLAIHEAADALFESGNDYLNLQMGKMQVSVS